MRHLQYISLIILSLMIASCGGGDSITGSNTTTVMINLGQREISTGAVSARPIPSSVDYIRFYISGSGMNPTERTISITGGDTIEVFEIPNGSNRHFEVFAYDNIDTLLYYGYTYEDLNGTTTTVTVIMVSVADETPPTFGGAVTATAISSTEIDLSWTTATDDVTPSSNIVYLIYISTASGGQDFLRQPNFTTAAGDTTYRVTGLFASTTYYFVVRAKDEAGNVDSNTVERSATTLTPSDATLPTFGGSVTATAISGTEIDLSWTAATDNVTPLSNIVYLIYISTTSGGQDLTSMPDFTTAAGDTTYRVTGLFASTTYYFVVRAKDEAGNVDSNTVERSATTLTPSDAIPPTFGGVITATAGSGMGMKINLSWAAATDNVTLSSKIVYLIYVSTTSGGQDFTTMPNFTTAAGVTTHTVTGLHPSTTYYFVVRAKDEAGNVDSNTVERSAAMGCNCKL